MSICENFLAFLFLLGSESYIPSTSVALRNSVAFTFSAISAAVPLVLWPGCSPPATTIRPLSTAFLTSA